MNYLDPVREQLNAMAYGLLAALPNIAIALIVLVLTWFMSKFAVGIAHRLTGRTELRADLKALVETLVRVGIWIVGLLVAAAVAIPGFTPAGMIAGLGLGALAIGFAFQDIFENFLAGVLIMLRDKMNIGDWIDVEGASGIVERITLRETHIRLFTGELIIMPNSMLFKNQVKVHTDLPQRRTDITVGVSYDSDLEQAEAAITRAVESVVNVDRTRPIEVLAREFGASSIDFWVRWWVDTGQQNIFLVQRDVIFAIKRELDAAKIEIPFPYLTHTFKEPLGLGRAEKTA